MEPEPRLRQSTRAAAGQAPAPIDVTDGLAERLPAARVHGAGSRADRVPAHRPQAIPGSHLLKQVPGWTATKIRGPGAADRWTWLIITCHAQLRLARGLAAGLRRPWDRPCAPGRGIGSRSGPGTNCGRW